MRFTYLVLLFFELFTALSAQSLALFQRLEECPTWPCVVDLAAAAPAARLDRALPWRLPLPARAGSAARLSSSYGARTHPLTGRAAFHAGVDLAAPYASPVAAAGSGYATPHPEDPAGPLGLYVVVDHLNGFTSTYAHLSAIHLAAPAFVAQGEVLGAVGSTGHSTGTHLHWSVAFRGRALDPLALRRRVLAGL